MNLRLLRAPVLLTTALLALAGGCKTTPEDDPEKPKPATTAAAEKTKPKKPVTTMRDMRGDVAFQAFLGRLRAAVAAKDVHEIAGMMTTNFGYHLNPDLEGEGVFAYWDQNNVWPELQLVMREPFVPFGDARDGFMVAPPEFASAGQYTGYRAGVQLVNGGWKFAYFVNGNGE